MRLYKKVILYGFMQVIQVNPKIINQAGGPDIDRQSRQGRAVNSLQGLERLGIDNGDIVNPAGMLFDDGFHAGRQFAAIAHTCDDFVPAEVQGLIETEGLLTLRAGEVAVSAAKGQTIGIADNRAYTNIQRQVQIPHHPAQNQRLLSVFLAEKGDIRPDNPEKLGTDGGHTAKVARAGNSAKAFGQTGHIHPGQLRLRVHLLRRRSKDEVGSQRFAKAGIRLQCAGIFFKILAGPN